MALRTWTGYLVVCFALTTLQGLWAEEATAFAGILQFNPFEAGRFNFPEPNPGQQKPFPSFSSPAKDISSRFPSKPSVDSFFSSPIPSPPPISFPNPEEFQRASAFLSGFVIVFVLADGNMCFTSTSSSINMGVQQMGSGTFVRTFGYLTGSGQCEDGARGVGVAVLTAQAFAEVQRLGDVCETRTQASGQLFRTVIGEGIDVDVSANVGAEAECPIVPENPTVAPEIVAEASNAEPIGEQISNAEANTAENNTTDNAGAQVTTAGTNNGGNNNA